MVPWEASRVQTRLLLDSHGLGKRQVSLSSEIWRRVLDGDQQLVERVVVALSPARHGIGAHLPAHEILCWATQAQKVVEEGVYASAEWLHDLYDRFRCDSIVFNIRSVKLVKLTSVTLVANDTNSYLEAQERGSELQSILVDRLLGQGDILEFLAESTFRIAYIEPVQQGQFHQLTQLHVVLSSGAGLQSSPNISDEDVDIPEAFLASSLGAKRNALSQSQGTRKAVNGEPLRSNEAPPDRFELLCAPLTAMLHDDDLRPVVSKLEDDECRVLLKPADMVLRGLMSGQQVVLTGNTSGLARAYTMPPALLSESKTQALLPPAFLYNLTGMEAPSKDPIRLFIEPVCTTHTLGLPVANMVTISRVCSPISIDRRYQALCLAALKRHFEQRQRCLRSGDIIAVPIDLAQSSLTLGDLEEDDLETGCIPEAATELAYFRVTRLDLDTTAIKRSLDERSIRHRISRGELGALIDPHVTKMVQSGTCQQAVPGTALGRYLSVSCDLGLSSAPSISASIYELVKVGLRADARELDLSPSLLIRSNTRGTGKRNLAKRLACEAGLHFLDVDAYDLIGDTDIKTEAQLRVQFEKAVSCAPCLFILRHLEALARKTQTMETGQEPALACVLRDLISETQQAWKANGLPIIVGATSSFVDRIPTSVLACFKSDFAVDAPDEEERMTILNELLECDVLAADVSRRSIALRTAALVARDLVDLILRVRCRAWLRIQNAGVDMSLSDVAAAGVTLAENDFKACLDQARSAYSESIGAPSIPNVTWDDVGGLAHVKSEILETIQLPLERPELFVGGLKKRSGILLYGPPGTGKTLLAKAVATSCSLNFFSVKGPELLNMYIGESEANVRRVFQRARDAKPCVIFFDELDSVAPKRGNQGDSGGVMDRIVSQLLAELDGMSDGDSGTEVFVIGATNRPDLLDPALLRPGRFDRMLYLGVSESHEAQLRIIQALTRKFPLDPDVDLAKIASQCAFNYTGADLYALCSDAMLKAMSRKAEAIDATIHSLNQHPPYSDGTLAALTPQHFLSEMAGAEDTQVSVSQVDFESALLGLVPSVSPVEMEHYAKVQMRFNRESRNFGSNYNDGTSGNTSDSVDKKGKARFQ